MQYSTRAFPLYLVVALTLTALVSPPSAAQVANVKFKGKVEELWTSRSYTVNSGVPATIDTVPVGRRLVVTDLLVTNENAGTAVVQLDSGSGSYAEVDVLVPAESVFAHSFATGILFEPGTEVRATATAPGQVQFLLTGYLMKAK